MEAPGEATRGSVPGFAACRVVLVAPTAPGVGAARHPVCCVGATDLVTQPPREGASPRRAAPPHTRVTNRSLPDFRTAGEIGDHHREADNDGDRAHRAGPPTLVDSADGADPDQQPPR